MANNDYDLLMAAYQHLTQVIRNRDALSYIKDVRKDNFPHAERVFVPAFNILTGKMKDHV